LKINSTILLIGIGNNCRADDGLGWRFIEAMEGFDLESIDYEYRYQLQVEDAALISEYDVVVFVDATYEKFSNGFDIRSCTPDNDCTFSTHAQSPGAIVSLTNTLYNIFPKAYLIAICGEEWSLQSYLSETAEINLQAAVSFFTGQFLPENAMTFSNTNTLSTIT
jgi:hydrogenase maturation protease